jgi:multiple sugar transport system substrate-binding protein
MKSRPGSTRRWIAALTAAALALVVAGCGGSGGGDAATGGSKAVAGATPSGPVTITVWHTNVDAAAKTIRTLADQFEAKNPNITVKTEQGAPADQILTKLSTVLSTDNYPDIAYVFGTDTPALARSPKVVDLTDVVNAPAFGWDDFYGAEREVATVDGKVVAIPALVDNLAVVYNKKLFREAGVAPPNADWSWDDYRATAKKVTNADQKIFGTAYPVAGDEDSVWRFWPMIWQQGGEAISDDGTKAPFDGPEYTKALELLRAMTLDDKSMYVDANPDAIYQLFANEKIAMVVTGPFALSNFDESNVDYGVVQLPAFDGDHQTVSGPDNWIVLDHDADRTAASAAFLSFLAAPEQDAVWSVGLANMPIRNATQKTPAWKKVATTNPAFQTFADNFVNTKKKRPQTIVYPAYSLALGEQIAAVLTGQSSVEDALATAKQNAEAALLDAAP